MTYNCSPASGGCDRDFVSLTTFDSHLETLRGETPARCRTDRELSERGLAFDGEAGMGKWYNPATLDAARMHFAKAGR